jgi:hypothetical protein
MEFMNYFRVDHGAALPLPVSNSSYAFAVFGFIGAFTLLGL